MTRATLSIAPVLILCCVDYRYIEAIQKFVKRRFGAKRYSLKTDAGATRALLRGPRSVQAWIWRNLKLAYERQGVRRFFLFHHQDCLLYGGSAAFRGPSEEAQTHLSDLRRAKALLTLRFRHVRVSGFYAHRTRGGIGFKPV